VQPSVGTFTKDATTSSYNTYYIVCKDAAWNTWWTTQIQRRYYVYTYLDNITWTVWTYNTSNYTKVDGKGPYHIPNNTTLTLSDLYYVPACSTLKWWSYTGNTTSLNTAATTKITKNRSYYVWFDRNTYDLALQAWTWISSVSGSWTYKYGASASISAVVEDGYTWGGWTKIDGTDLTTFTPATQSQDVVLACGTTTLKATTTLNAYTITYNLNWWTNNVNNPSSYTVESNTITLQAPTKTWYTFLWWTWSNGTTPQTSVTIASWSTWDKTYNAVWQANTYKISYTMNGWTNCSPAPTTATYDVSFTW